MTPEQFQRIDELFTRASDLSAHEREALLDLECADDPVVRAEVEALLVHDQIPNALLETPITDLRLEVGEFDDDASSEVKPPDRIGPYEILDLLGMGGMGVVYRARQSNPRRIVALKVLRPGLVTHTMLKRFDQEAQALGRLHHPGIGRIYEAATTSTSAGQQPFFVMEYLEGEPITRYVQRKQLGSRDRLDLMLKICSAVSHAHQRGVIHRDLKPGNILVDEMGHPSILDFGVARIIDSDFQTTLRTDVGQLIGTIPYMSPEQIVGDPLAIDTRVDVYALGVLLFELLTDQLPLDVRDKTIPEAARIIRDEDPNRLSSISRVFRGDLETIVAKALEKEPDRRYQSVEEFAGDLQRYLQDEPIVARPASTTYQLRKFAKRNQALVGGMVAVFVVLVAGIIVSATFAVREAGAKRDALEAANQADLARAEAETAQLAEADQRKRAQREATLAKAVSTYLQDTFSAPDPWGEGAAETSRRDVKVVDVLDDSVAGLDKAFPDQLEVKAMLLQVLGRTYVSLGRYEEGNLLLERAVEIHTQKLGSDPASMLDLRSMQANLAQTRGRFSEAERHFRGLIDHCESTLGSDHETTLTSRRGLAMALLRQDLHEEAEDLLLDLLERGPDLLSETEQGVVSITMSALCIRLGRNDEAERYYREGIDTFTQELGVDHPQTLLATDNLINLLLEMERLDEAADLLTRTSEAKRRVLGDEHPETLRTQTHLAHLQRRRGLVKESLELTKGNLEAHRRALGDDHPDTLTVMNNLAAMHKDNGHYDLAAELFKESWERSAIVLGEGHAETLVSLSNYGLALFNQGRFEEAEPLIHEAWQAHQSFLGDEHPNTLTLLDNLAVVYVRLNRLEESEAMFREAFRLKGEAFGFEHSETLVSLNNLAYVNSALGRHEEAMKLNRQALETRRKALGEMHPDTLFSLHNIGLIHVELAEFDEAIPMFSQAHEYRRQVLGADHPDTMSSLLSLASAHKQSGDLDGALRQTAVAMEVGRTLMSPDSWRLGDVLVRHGAYLVLKERYDEAEPTLDEARSLLESTLGEEHWLTRFAYESLVLLYEKTDRPDEAAELQRRLGSPLEEERPDR